MAAARQVFAAQADHMRQLFEREVHALQAEHKNVNELVKFYQKKLKKQATALATQECIIAKLSNHISTNMKGRLRTRALQKEVLNVLPVLDDDECYAEIFAKDQPKDKRARDPLKQGLYRQPFDLYGGSFRLFELPERDAALTNVILRDKQVEIRGLQQQLDASEEMSRFLKSDWERSVGEASDLKIALAEAVKKLAEQEARHEEHIAMVKRQFQ